MNVCEIFDFVVLGIILGATCLVGFVSNALIVATVCQQRKATATSFMMQALAFCDFGILLIQLTLVIPAWCQFIGDDACRGYFRIGAVIKVYLVVPVGTFITNAGAYTTVMITILRYICVCHPLRTKDLATLRVASISVPKFWRERVYYDQNASSWDSEKTDYGRSETYRIGLRLVASNVVSFAVPILLSSVLTARIIRSFKRRRLYLMVRVHQMSRDDREITKSLLIIIIMFLVSQSLQLVNQTIGAVIPEHMKECPYFRYFLVDVVYTVVAFSSACNIVIYFVFTRGFRRSFLVMMGCSEKAAMLAGTSRANTQNKSFIYSEQATELQQLNHYLERDDE